VTPTRRRCGASTGHQALRLAAALEPEVALVDIELAGEDGIALTEELDARAPSTRIVLISTYERDDLADLILDSPAVGFLPKAPSTPPRSQVCSAHAPESLRLEDTIVYDTTTRLSKRFP
jgi:DNA-binding NarL/FixJ family response regulator